jgi:Xaa-Pro aminopeptidase
VGEPPSDFRRTHDLIIEAQASAMKSVISGKITAARLDSVARNLIVRAGYGECFTHRLGHGIGVTVHEPPFLYPPDETLLVSNMTFTVEPSIRIPDGYACRVEDVVLVTEQGGLPLTNFSKELAVIK